MKPPLPHWPRGLGKPQAAAYLSVSTSLFDKLLLEGAVPPGRKISEGRTIWLKEELDDYLSCLPVEQDEFVEEFKTI